MFRQISLNYINLKKGHLFFIKKKILLPLNKRIFYSKSPTHIYFRANSAFLFSIFEIMVLMFHPDEIIRICALLIGTPYGVGRFSERTISGDYGSTNGILNHDIAKNLHARINRLIMLILSPYIFRLSRSKKNTSGKQD